MTTTADRLEARARKAMHELALSPARGWDGERDRAPVLAVLDQVLDARLDEQAKVQA